MLNIRRHWRGIKAISANYMALKENLALAREVYDVIQLQYRSGIKTYSGGN